MSNVWPYHFSWVIWGSYNHNNNIKSLEAAYGAGVRNAVYAFVIDNERTGDFYGNLNDIKKFISLGGKLRVSFGGASGILFDETKTDYNSLYAIYKNIINQSGVTDFDFDIEGHNLGKWDADARRNNVLVGLQKEFPKLLVSFTLACDQNGLSQDSIRVLRDAVNKGVIISCVNVMLMDNGWSDSGRSSVEGVISLAKQLSSLFPQKSSDQINKMIGACFMIGQNDDASKFTLENAKFVVDYFNSIGGIGYISYWGLQRDVKSTPSDNYNNASQLQNNDLDYFKAFSLMKVSSSGSSGGVTVPVPNQAPDPIIKPLCSRSCSIDCPPITKIILGDVIANTAVVEDPKPGWLKINNVTTGESPEFAVRQVTNSNVGQLLDSVTNDTTVSVVNYNWSTGTAFLRSGYNTKKPTDSKFNDGWVTFVKK